MTDATGRSGLFEEPPGSPARDSGTPPPPLERRVGYLEDRLETLDDALASRLAGYEHVERRLVFRLAELERSDARLAERLEEAARFDASFGERLEALDETLRVAGELVRGELPQGVRWAEERLREIADEIEASLATRTAALERTENALGDRLASLRRHDAELTQNRQGLQRAVAAAEEVAEASLPAAAARLRDALHEQAAEADAAFAARLEALEDIESGLLQRGVDLGHLEKTLSHRAEDVGRAAALVDDRARQLAGLDERLDARTEALVAAVAEVERIAGTGLPEALALLEQELSARTAETADALAGHVAAGEHAEARLSERTTNLEQLEGAFAERAAELERSCAVLTERLARLQQATASVERAGGRDLTERLERLDRSVSGLADVVADLESGGEAISASVAQQREAQDRYRRDLASAIRGAEARMVAAVQDGVSGFVDEATEASTAARSASARLASALRELGELEDALSGHRSAFEEALVRDRRVLLEEVLELVVAELPKRSRQRLANRLLERREGGYDDPAPSGVGPASPAPPEPPPGPSEPPPGPSTAETEASAVGAGEPESDEGEIAPGTDAASADTPVVRPDGPGAPGDVEPGDDTDATGSEHAHDPAARLRVHTLGESYGTLRELLGEEFEVAAEDPDAGLPLSEEDLRAARRARAEAARDELAERVLQVRGIGPARADLLVQAFGDLDTLVSATADDVVERTGLSAAVAEELLADLRG